MSTSGENSHVEIKIAADVADLQRNVRAASETMASFAKVLEGTNKKLEEQEKAGKKVSLGFGSMVKGIATAADQFNEIKAAITGVAEIGKTAIEFAKFNGELRQMQKVVPTKLLKEMREAVGGAVDDVTLMKSAMASMNGEMALTDDGMKVVLQAADNLADKLGGDTMEAFNAMISAIRSGRTGELKQLGMNLTETGDKQKDLNNLMVEFAKLASTPVDVDPQLEAIERLQAATTNWLNDMKSGIGSMVHFAIQGLDAISDKLAGVYKPKDNKEQTFLNATAEYSKAKGLGLDSPEDIYDLPGTLDAMMQDPDFISILNRYDDRMKYGEMVAGQKDTNKQHQDFVKNLMNAKLGKLLKGKRHKKPGTITAGGFEGANAFGLDLYGATQSFANAPAMGMSWLNMQSAMGDVKQGMDWDAAQQSSLNSDASKLSGVGQLFAQGTAGAPDAKLKKFTEQVQDSTSAVGAAYSTMASALSASIDAAISGSDNIARAAAKAAATQLKAIAIESSVKALYSTAEGLFTRNPAAFAAAAKYAATAAAAGVGAAALGALGGSGGGHASGGGSGGYGGSSGASGEGSYYARGYQTLGRGFTGETAQSITINITSDYLTADKASLGQVVQDAVNRARASGRSRSDSSRIISYD